jgi:Transposase
VIEQECWSSFAGIDWGGEHHQLCIVDDAGRRKSQLRVTHDVTGLADLDREMCRFADHLPVAIERSEGLLVEHLQRRGHFVFPGLAADRGASAGTLQGRLGQSRSARARTLRPSPTFLQFDSRVWQYRPSLSERGLRICDPAPYQRRRHMGRQARDV